MKTTSSKPLALDFFAGSGLVTEGLSPWFNVVWANDNCPKKGAVYAANFDSQHLCSDSIETVTGESLPAATLAWASFPCQDLSLAGNMAGIVEGDRSSMFWQWLRVLDEMPETRRPPVLAIENVVGFLVGDKGKHFAQAFKALRRRGYVVGALEIDAVHFVPQSRPRSFLIAVRKDVDYIELARDHADYCWHSKNVMSARSAVNGDGWVWWRLPIPNTRSMGLQEIIDFGAPVDSNDETNRFLGMLSDTNRIKLNDVIQSGELLAGTGYKRTRPGDDGVRRQRLEIRFDNLAGCLRTPGGGSSRQMVIIVNRGKVKTRLLTVRETARLMGVRDTFLIPGSYNDGYHAMGDAVAVPVTKWLAEHLLQKLAKKCVVRSVCYAT